MAYQAKRSKIFKEEFQLVDENGEIAKTLFVELDPSVVASNLSKKYLALQHCLTAVKNVSEKKETEKMYETVGMAVKDILETVFGKKDTQTIVEFYDSRYIEMCREVLPFVSEVVVPQVRKLAQENKADIIAGYNRKQKRAFMFGKKHG